MFTVVVTGITGKSGQYFLKNIIEHSNELKDYRFILLCRGENDLVNKALEIKTLNIERRFTDLKDKDELNIVFSEKVDMLFHIASVKLSLDVVPVALEHGVNNIVLVHTTGIYSKYKAAGEEYRRIESEIARLVEDYNNNGRSIALTILRPTMIYGDLNDKNVSTFIKMVDKLRLFPVINGARYDLQPVWCKDLGDAYYSVLTKWDVAKNKEYILSGGEPIQLRDMFSEIARQLDKKITFVTCPFFIAYVGACVIWAISFTKIDYREKVQRMVEPRAYSHEMAAKDLEYKPSCFADGVREEILMYKEKNNG